MFLEPSKPAAKMRAVCGGSRSTTIRQAKREMVLEPPESISSRRAAAATVSITIRSICCVPLRPIYKKKQSKKSGSRQPDGSHRQRWWPVSGFLPAQGDSGWRKAACTVGAQYSGLMTEIAPSQWPIMKLRQLTAAVWHDGVKLTSFSRILQQGCHQSEVNKRSQTKSLSFPFINTCASPYQARKINSCCNRGGCK